ncbi:MAG: insulinase family protein [Candidatus Latescibacteria bacterium]|nr:insulinase family protein [Candidatus Latescibacterota bacterium]
MSTTALTTVIRDVKSRIQGGQMSYRLIRAALLVALMIALSTGVAESQKHYSELRYPPLNAIDVPDAERVKLRNGIILYLVEDHRLPMINLRARIGVGAIDDPADKTGLAGITGSVMRTGGTDSMSGDEIDEAMESIGASIETGIGRTSGFARMTVLRGNLDTALPILADILIKPAFAEEKIELQKVQTRSAIARRNDDANGIASREFSKLIYGAESVFGRQAEYATIDAISRDDLVAFHERYFVPGNVMIGISGDFDTKEMRSAIESALGRWEKQPLQRTKTPDVKYDFNRSVHYIEKNDVNQSSIFLGHIGGLRNSRDYFALQVMNDILSGGFSGRLMRNVRSDQGLAYAVFGQYSANYDYPGIFYVGCMTRSDATVQAIQSMLREVERMRSEDVTDEELTLAKESFLNSFVFNFDTRGEVIDRKMTYEYYGYPKDFLERTKEGIEKVSRADVKRVAEKYLKPDLVRILVVGRGEDFGTPLASLGPVNVIDISIQTPEVETPEVSEDALARGRSLLNRAVAAAGGSEAFKKVQAIHESGRATMVTPQGDVGMDVTSIMAYPDRVRVTVVLPQGEMVQIMNGSDAWLITPMGTQPAPGPMNDTMINNIWQSIVYLYGHSEDTALGVQYVGTEDVDGAAAEVLHISPPGARSFKLYLDASTMLPLKRSAQEMTPNGPAEMDQYLSDFREINGLMLPFKRVIMSNGQKAGEATNNEILINPEISDELFNAQQ